MEVMNTKIADSKDYKSLFDRHNSEMVDLWRMYASKIWLDGFKETWNQINQPFTEFDINGWTMYACEDMVSEDIFWSLLKMKKFPINTLVRHEDNFDYCVLPESLHDRIHLPALANDRYSRLLRYFGNVGVQANDNKIVSKYLANLYWATVEFGLIEEDGEMKAFGAGVLSSKKELLSACHNTKETQRPFNALEIFTRDYDPHGIQDVHYVIESIEQVFDALVTLNMKNCLLGN